MTPLSPESQAEFAESLGAMLGHMNFQIFPLAGDASARRYYRVVTEKPSGQDSWVLMSWDPFKDDGNYPFLSVRDHFAKHGVSVPAVVGKNPDKGLILLEDLGDLTLERKFWENQSQQLALPYYRQAIDELIKMHYPATFDKTDCTAFKIEFDVDKLMWEMNYGREHLLVKLCEIKLSEIEKRELEKVFLKICSFLHAEPKYIAHRDYHSRNVMLKHGKARVIDFQDARLGPVQYDLVSLLRDSYVNMEEPIARELIGYYLDKRKEVVAPGQLEDISLEKFMRTYEVQTIQRCFKACGSFASFFNLRSDTRYLKYLVPTLQTVKKSLWAFDEYRPFYDLLNDHGVFEKTF
jgi:N-acetylmuramate 1-kinase